MKKRSGPWAAAVFVATAELAIIGRCYVPAEYDELLGRWWILVAAAFACGLMVLGWKSERLMRRLLAPLWYFVLWAGVPGCVVVVLSTQLERSGTIYYYRLNNRQFNALIDQFKLDNPERIFIRFDDLVGPTKMIPSLRTEFDADYRDVFPIAINTPVYQMPCAGHRTIVMFPDVSFVILDRKGRPLVRYCVPAELTEWKALMQTPDGVQAETTPDGRRIETTFHHGWPDGPFKVFGPDGRVYAEATYVKGHLTGPCWRYRNDGSRFDEGQPGTGFTQ